jgi:DNA-binding NtrC family response regulator
MEQFSVPSALLFVDDDADLREVVVDATSHLLGMERCVAVGSLDELRQHREDALTCTLAVIDINLGLDAPSGIDVYQWLMTERFGGKIAFLTGHGADDARVQKAATIGTVPVLTKPIRIAGLAALASAASGDQ